MGTVPRTFTERELVEVRKITSDSIDYAVKWILRQHSGEAVFQSQSAVHDMCEIESANTPMSLAPGTHLGPFEILAPIGAGGMGEVYRAKDTKLKREVALKVLPDSFASDPARM